MSSVSECGAIELTSLFEARRGEIFFARSMHTKMHEWDPYHPITMAISGLGDAWQPTYLAGADIVQPENYPGDGSTGLAYKTVDIMSRFLYNWAPRFTCRMAWTAPITSTAMFRVELYDVLAAGGTGSI